MTDRTWTRILFEVDVAHDGDPEDVLEHLAEALEAAVGRATGVECLDLTGTAKVRHPGDGRSPALPAGW